MVKSTQTLRVGDYAPLFGLLDQDQNTVILRDLAGDPLLLFFYAKDKLQSCQEVALAFRDIVPTCESLGIKIYGISLDAPLSRQAFSRQHNIPFPLLSDLDYAVSLLYGVCQEDTQEPGKFIYSRTAILFDTNLRIIKIYNLNDLPTAINDILIDIKFRMPRLEPTPIGMHPPVLLIPQVLNPYLCRQLIQVWKTQGNDESGFMRRAGDKTVGYIDYSHKRRRDHFIQDEVLLSYLDRVMNLRVFPEIKKAFSYEATRREAYKIAGYDASVGGYFRKHRDNTTGGTAHRRFAMTLNLNVGEYEGGYLKFPEYSQHLYKPDTGDVIIFSCSLMHEATDVTSGVRFALLSFFYGEAEAKARDAYESQVNNNYDQVVKMTD